MLGEFGDRHRLRVRQNGNGNGNGNQNGNNNNNNNNNNGNNNGPDTSAFNIVNGRIFTPGLGIILAVSVHHSTSRFDATIYS